jgi:hypothetical protein
MTVSGGTFMKIATSSVLCILMLFSLVGVVAAASPAPVAIPTFTITNVIPDQQVTIQTQNFPPNQTFRVLMGKIGTLGVNGIEVDKTSSGSGGSFSATYSIPPDFAGQRLIAIRLQSSEGFFSYNWFENATPTATAASPNEGAAVTATPAATIAPAVTLSPTAQSTPIPVTGSTFPSMQIVSVVKDSSVTVQASNLPAGMTFNVTMGAFGTAGVGGTSVGQTDSGSGGSLQVVYTIPAELHGKDRIAIRMQSAQGFFAYNWFWNQSTTP